MTSINEIEYHKSVDMMIAYETSFNLRFLQVCNIYNKLNKETLNDETSDDFLYKCYVDTVMELGWIIKFVFSCVRNGVLHLPRDCEDSRSGIYSSYMNSNVNGFKSAAMDAIIAVNESRIKIAQFMLARANKTEYMEHFYVYSRGAHRELGDNSIVTNLYRCLRHIHSGDINFDLKFGDTNHVLYRFDAMFCSTNTLDDYKFFVNAKDSFKEKIVEFDPAITNHNKTKYATFRGFVCATTGEKIP